MVINHYFQIRSAYAVEERAKTHQRCKSNYVYCINKVMPRAGMQKHTNSGCKIDFISILGCR